jgi:hypothetical protein
MISSPYATERTRAIMEGRKEKDNLMSYNGKPFRTKAQKRIARESARRHKGTWVSSAPVSHHPRPKGDA